MKTTYIEYALLIACAPWIFGNVTSSCCLKIILPGFYMLVINILASLILQDFNSMPFGFPEMYHKNFPNLYMTVLFVRYLSISPIQKAS